MRIFSKYTTFCLVLLLTTTIGYSQVFEEDNSVDGKYMPPENSLFHIGKEQNKKMGYSSVTTPEHGNVIKWNMTSIARGASALEYERKIAGNFVLMGTAGLTFFPDYIKWTLVNSFIDGETISINSDGLGIVYGGEAKYYFDYVFDDGYWGIGFRSLQYSLEAQTLVSSAGVTGGIANKPSFTETNRDFYMTWGFMDHYSDNFVGEVSVSTGARLIDSQTTTTTDVWNPNTSSYDSFVTLSPDSRFVFTFFFSYKLGFSFGD